MKLTVAATEKAIGARIRALRLQRKLSQTQIGEALGVTLGEQK